jgi:hypothetical protein
VNERSLDRPWWLLPPGRLPAAWWIVIGALFLAVDCATGLSDALPAFYIIPVALAAWYSGRRPALTMAIGLPVVHLILRIASSAPGSLGALVAAATIRGSIIIVMALWFARLSEHERELHRHVHELEGLLPICAFCKKIRNEAGEWERLEAFISKRSQAHFSHSICPACGKTHYPD